jgi:glycerate kinase
VAILIAPDSFKGTFTAAEVCAHIAAGVGSVHEGLGSYAG